MDAEKNLNKRAIALLSGGLDSTLAIKIMLNQGIEVVAVNFTSPFCNCTSRKNGCPNQAQKVARELGVPIIVLAKGMDYLKIVEKPAHGYGRGMNPCLDCRIYMLKKVKEIMPSVQASFIITGEVLGQRPMSQHRQALQLIEKKCGLEGLIVRPLSAQNLPPTLPELAGVVDREKLFSISGRSRQIQLSLAADFNIKDYPCPAGGCLLTDPVIAARLKDLFLYFPNYTMADLAFLKIGRHFRLSPELKIILGRNKDENEHLRALWKPGLSLFYPQNFKGPTAIAFGSFDQNASQMIGEIIACFSKEERDSYILKEKNSSEEEKIFTVVKKFPREQLEQFRIGGAGKSYGANSKSYNS